MDACFRSNSATHISPGENNSDMVLLRVSECIECMRRKHRGRDPLQKRKAFFDYLWLACLLDFIFNSLSKPYPAFIITYAVPVKMKPTQLEKKKHLQKEILQSTVSQLQTSLQLSWFNFSFFVKIVKTHDW